MIKIFIEEVKIIRGKDGRDLDNVVLLPADIVKFKDGSSIWISYGGSGDSAGKYKDRDVEYILRDKEKIWEAA